MHLDPPCLSGYGEAGAVECVKQAYEELVAARINPWNEVDDQIADPHHDLKEVAKELLTGQVEPSELSAPPRSLAVGEVV